MEATKTQDRKVPPKLDADSASEKLHIVVPSRWVDAVDAWRKAQPGRVLNRSEAIRQLVEMGLKAGKPRKGGSK